MQSKKPLPVKRPYEDAERAYNHMLQRMQPTRPLFVQPMRHLQSLMGAPATRPPSTTDWHARTEWGYPVPENHCNSRAAVAVTVVDPRASNSVTSDTVLEMTAKAILEKRKYMLATGPRTAGLDSLPTYTDPKTQVVAHVQKAQYLQPVSGEGTERAANTTYRVGGDPEFFLVDSVGTVVPSGKALGLDPESPVALGLHPATGRPAPAFADVIHPGEMIIVNEHGGIYPTYGWVHQDGIQAELGYTPVKCLEFTSMHIVAAFNALKAAAQANRCSLSYQTSAKISPELAARYPLGCRPSLNAWGNDNTIVNPNPVKRFGGGHFHFGLFQSPTLGVTMDAVGPFNLAEYRQLLDDSGLRAMPDDFVTECINQVVKRLDATVGLISVAMGRGLDDPERRQHRYGMAGDYRLTNNTLEYRVPSNVVWFHPITWHICAMIGRQIMKMSWGKPHNLRLDKFIENNERDIVQAIDTTDPDLAVDLLRRYTNQTEGSLFDWIIRGGDTSLQEYPGAVKNLIVKGSAAYLRDHFQTGWALTNYTDANASLSRQSCIPRY